MCINRNNVHCEQDVCIAYPQLCICVWVSWYLSIRIRSCVCVCARPTCNALHMRISNSWVRWENRESGHGSFLPHINRILWQNHKFPSALSTPVFRYAMEHPFPQEVASERPTYFKKNRGLVSELQWTTKRQTIGGKNIICFPLGEVPLAIHTELLVKLLY